jgi:hypothetical protein
VNDSPGFNAKSVVYGYSQTLLAANLAFPGLHRDMTEEKLDLLKLASRIMETLSLAGQEESYSFRRTMTARRKKSKPYSRASAIRH